MTCSRALERVVMENSGYHVRPTPLVGDLLYLANPTKHRAAALFNGSLVYNDEYQGSFVKCGGIKFWGLLDGLDERVLEVMRGAGFGGTMTVKPKQVDHALVVGLLERWRPETHTFHLPFGEATVTLQDVNVLLGLRVDGPVVTGELIQRTFEQQCELVAQHLGIYGATAAYFNGNKINISKVREQVELELPANATVLEVRQRARCAIMCMFGYTLFCDTSNNWIPLTFLENLIDLEACRNLSWGSAVLAHLYHALCKGSLPTAKSVAGHMYLLLLWVWTRIKLLAPRRNIAILEGMLTVPYGAFHAPLKTKHVTRHVISAVRSQLAVITEAQFNWTPYEGVIYRMHPDCTDGYLFWRSECYIVCWGCVEYHPAGRVLRQFGIRQSIPPSPPYNAAQLEEMHGSGRAGRSYTNFGQFARSYIDSWDARRDTVVDGESMVPRGPTVDEGYYGWFIDRTVLFVTNPRLEQNQETGHRDMGTVAQVLAAGHGYQYQQAHNYQGAGGPDYSQQAQFSSQSIQQMYGNLHGYNCWIFMSGSSSQCYRPGRDP